MSVERRDAWTAEEIAVLRENYPVHGMTWDGWDTLLPSRTRAALQNRARKIGLRSPQGRKHGSHNAKKPRPRTCGECRFFCEGNVEGVGRCRERHARIMFGREPEVLARYDAIGLCLWGDPVDRG